MFSTRGAPTSDMAMQQRTPGNKLAAVKAQQQQEFAQSNTESIEESTPVTIFDLTQLVENLNGDPSNLGSQERIFHLTLVRSPADLKTMGGTMHCASTAFMRSSVTRSDVDFTAGPVANIPRLSEVDKILFEEATMLHRANDSSIEVGLRLDGMRGRVYTSAGEKGRFVDILPISSSHPDNFRIHLPTLTGLQVMASAFSSYDEMALKAEYADIPGDPTWVNVKYSADCKTLAHFFESSDPDLYSQYGVDPTHIKFNKVTTATGIHRLLPLPRKLVYDLHDNMFKSKEQLKHFNPTTSGLTYEAEFLPTYPGIDSWADIDNHPVVKYWLSQGAAFYNDMMSRPITLTAKVLAKFIADDQFTRDIMNERLNALLMPASAVEQDE